MGVIRLMWGPMRWLRRYITLVVFVGMSALLIASLTSTMVNALMTGAIATLTGVQTVAGELRKQVSSRNRDKRMLDDRVEALSREKTRSVHRDRKSTATVVALTEANRRLASRLNRLSTRIGALENRDRNVRQTLNGTRSRVITGTTRKFATTLLKTAPALGALIVSAMTAYDLADSCENLKELERLTAKRHTPHDEPPPISGNQKGLQGFCQQNSQRLTALQDALEPVMVSFDDVSEHGWTAATKMIARGEAAVAWLAWIFVSRTKSP